MLRILKPESKFAKYWQKSNTKQNNTHEIDSETNQYIS